MFHCLHCIWQKLGLTGARTRNLWVTLTHDLYGSIYCTTLLTTSRVVECVGRLNYYPDISTLINLLICLIYWNYCSVPRLAVGFTRAIRPKVRDKTKRPLNRYTRQTLHNNLVEWVRHLKSRPETSNLCVLFRYLHAHLIINLGSWSRISGVARLHVQVTCRSRDLY